MLIELLYIPGVVHAFLTTAPIGFGFDREASGSTLRLDRVEVVMDGFRRRHLQTAA